MRIEILAYEFYYYKHVTIVHHILVVELRKEHNFCRIVYSGNILYANRLFGGIVKPPQEL